MGSFGDFPGFGTPDLDPRVGLKKAGRKLVGAGVNAVESGVSNAAHSVTDSITGAIDGVGSSVNRWLGNDTGPSTSDAATAKGGDALHQDAPQSIWGRIGQNIGDLGRGVQQEGLGGLLDSGIVDRQQAQRDLSDRFQVVGADQKGKGASNQVSQQEYQDIARTFSNVRRGKGDLAIDSGLFSDMTMTSAARADKGNWEQGVQSNVADIMMTSSGRQQINNLSNNVSRDDKGAARTDSQGEEIHRKTSIKPLFDTDGVVTTDRQTGKNYNDLGAPWNRDASTLVHNNAFTEGGLGPGRSAEGGRGTGGDSTIMFNPGTQQGLRSDVSLVHEMNHALAQTQGTSAYGCFGSGPDSNTKNLERQAVGLSRTDSPGVRGHSGDPRGLPENIYREERNALGDQFAPRTSYAGPIPNTVPAGTTPDQLKSMWDTHNQGPNVPH